MLNRVVYLYVFTLQIISGGYIFKMDRFVVRKEKKDAHHEKQAVKCLKQSRLHQLKGVVILEELESANKKLNAPETPTDEKIAILSQLKDRKPAKEFLKSTGIGKTVHRLCRHPDPAVASIATTVYNFWKSHVLHILRRKPIEVESDAETQRGRTSAKKLINQGLDNSMLAEEIEIHVFNRCRKIMNKTYSRIVRKIHFTFKHEENQRRRVNEMNCDLKEFVDDMFNQVNKVYGQ